jgi:AraC family transcriptional regulator
MAREEALGLCAKSPFVREQPVNAGPAPPLRLEAGRGFETRSVRYQVDDFIIVDASMPPGLCAPLHVHERAYVTLMLRGGFDEQYGSRALSIRAGTMNFVPAGVPHRTHSHGAGLVRMEFPDTALAGAEELGPILRQPEAIADPGSVSLARRVVAEVRSGEPGWRLVVQGLLLELLGQIVRVSAGSHAASGPRWLRDVKERLDSDFSARASVTELASIARVHPVHLARRFRSSYGCSIGEYVRRRQLLAAEELLAGSQLDLREVALRCGYADQSHFSKAFRRSVGVPPGRYRRAHRGG